MKIFISYRRADEAVFVQLLWTHLSMRYGTGNVFLDFVSIPLFSKFEDFIKVKIAESDIVIPIIGKQWLNELKKRESKNNSDYVRIELEEAIRLKKLIAPIRIFDAPVPPLVNVPISLHPIFDLNITEIAPGQDFEIKFSRITSALDNLMTNSGLQPTAEQKAMERKFDAALAQKRKTPLQSLDKLMSSFTEIMADTEATHEQLAQGLIVLSDIRNQGGVPAFFKLADKETELQKRLRETQDRLQREEVAEYLYGFVRHMHKMGDSITNVRTALREVWAIVPNYDPDNIGRSVTIMKRLPSITRPRASSDSSPSIHNPINWIRIYVWIFFRPSANTNFWDSFDELSADFVRTRLSLAMISLCLVIPILSEQVRIKNWWEITEVKRLTFTQISIPVLIGIWVSLIFLEWIVEGYQARKVVGVMVIMAASGIVTRISIPYYSPDVVQTFITIGVAMIAALISFLNLKETMLKADIEIRYLILAVSAAIPLCYNINGFGIDLLLRFVVFTLLAFVLVYLMSALKQPIYDRAEKRLSTPARWQIFLGILPLLLYIFLFIVYFVI